MVEGAGCDSDWGCWWGEHVAWHATRPITLAVRSVWDESVGVARRGGAVWCGVAREGEGKTRAAAAARTNNGDTFAFLSTHGERGRPSRGERSMR